MTSEYLSALERLKRENTIEDDADALTAVYSVSRTLDGLLELLIQKAKEE